MSDEKRRPRPAAQYGPTAETVAHNVKRFRELRGMTIYSLSGALGKAGRPITPSAIAKIEKQQRQVTVDDVAALAAVLNISPLTLMLPAARSGEVQVSGTGTVEARDAWKWGIGTKALPPVGKSTVDAERQAEYERLVLSLPQHHPAVRATRELLERIEYLAAATGVIDDPDHFSDNQALVLSSIKRVEAEVEHLGLEHEQVRARIEQEIGASNARAVSELEKRAKGRPDDERLQELLRRAREMQGITEEETD